MPDSQGSGPTAAPEQVTREMRVSRRRLLGFAGAIGAAVVAGCGPAPSRLRVSDGSAAIFDPDHLVEVDVEIAEANWDALRLQTRDFLDVLGPGCLDAPIKQVFDWFPATVTVDGVRVPGATVRKKGLVGSLRDDKPSLKIRYPTIAARPEIFGERRLTLNNAAQDPSLMREVVSYGLLREAGVPAPRANHARVTVNGRELGPYVHVESIKKPFLRRHFASDDGVLYEGALSDFHEPWFNTFALKSDRGPADVRDLRLIGTALTAPDDALLERLAEVLDVQAFLTFWAGEIAIGHGDGYAGNANNFWLYSEPGAERFFHFIPWGVDMTLHGQAPLLANSELPRRLLLHPDGNLVIREELRRLLEEVWDESRLIAGVERMETLLAGTLPDERRDAWRAQVSELRAVIMAQPASIATEVDRLTNPPPLRPRDPPCAEVLGSLEAEVRVRWGSGDSEDPFVTGSGELRVEVDGEQTAFDRIGARAGPAPGGGPTVLEVFGARADGLVTVVHIEFAGAPTPTEDGDYEGRVTAAVLATVDPQGSEPPRPTPLAVESVRFDRQPQDGEEVLVTIRATVVERPG